MAQEDFWLKFKEGDKTAFESLYKMYIDDMYAYGLKISADKELVKDCIQEVFIDIYERRNHISEPRKIRFYILKALKHNIFGKLKKEKRKVQINTYTDFIFTTEYNAEDKKIDEEINGRKEKLLKKALQTLSSKQKEILYLRFSMGLTYPEISEIVKIDSTSVRKQVYRGLKKLRNSEAFESYKNHKIDFRSPII